MLLHDCFGRHLLLCLDVQRGLLRLSWSLEVLVVDPNLIVSLGLRVLLPATFAMNVYVDLASCSCLLLRL